MSSQSYVPGPEDGVRRSVDDGPDVRLRHAVRGLDEEASRAVDADAGVRYRRRSATHSPSTTVFRSVPTPSYRISTSSPGSTSPGLAGLPNETTSPGLNV